MEDLTLRIEAMKQGGASVRTLMIVAALLLLTPSRVDSLMLMGSLGFGILATGSITCDLHAASSLHRAPDVEARTIRVLSLAQLLLLGGGIFSSALGL